MKILHVCLASFYVDNYSYQENLLPKFHRKMGHEVEIVASLVTFDKDGQLTLLGGPSTYVNEHGIRVTRLRYQSFPYSQLLRCYQGLDRVLARMQPDVLFIHGIQFLDSLIVRRYAKIRPELMIYVDNHADFSNSARSFASRRILHGILWKSMARLMNPFTTRFYGVLPGRVDFLKEVYGLEGDRVELLVMGADDDQVDAALHPDQRTVTRRELGVREDDFLIVTGGKIDLAKRQVLTLMRFVKQSTDTRLRLVVFGSVVPELKEEVSGLTQSERVTYVGWADTAASYKYFAAADLVVFPGRHSVYWEQACGMGKPLVVKWWPGTTHVDFGGNCRFLESDTSEELRTVLHQVIYDPDALNAMEVAARDKAMKQFSYADIAARSISDTA